MNWEATSWESVLLCSDLGLSGTSISPMVDEENFVTMIVAWRILAVKLRTDGTKECCLSEFFSREIDRDQ